MRPRMTRDGECWDLCEDGGEAVNNTRKGKENALVRSEEKKKRMKRARSAHGEVDAQGVWGKPFGLTVIY